LNLKFSNYLRDVRESIH